MIPASQRSHRQTTSLDQQGNFRPKQQNKKARKEMPMNKLKQRAMHSLYALGLGAAALAAVPALKAAPIISRLTPPSALFSFGDTGEPYTSRFLPGQRFDLQVTVRPDADQTITGAEFYVNGRKVQRPVAVAPATVSGVPSNTVIFTVRAYAGATRVERNPS